MANKYSIGEKVKNLREQSGLTQAQMADYLNVDQSYLSRYEKNERQFSMELLEKIANLFGCPLEYITSDDSLYVPLPFALRATGIHTEDLEAIAAINTIALNLRAMESLLKER